MNKYLIILLFNIMGLSIAGQTTNPYVKTSKEFLQTLRKSRNTDEIVKKIGAYSMEELKEGLKTDKEKFAFWINIYNGFIQRKLGANPELYEDRGSFFKKKFINIGGQMVCFADIEHGIIRKSSYEYFLGYISNPFPGKWEKSLRVSDKDFRIHFALNCGAKSCPPVGIYDDTKLDEQMEQSTKMFLKKFTEETDDKIKATSLFSWFRGDFGGKSGARNILKNYGVVNNPKGKDFEYSYDWTLMLDNWIDLE